MPSLQLALNYSKPAEELLLAGVIAPDLFKCPDWPDLMAAAAAHRPIYVHFDLKAGNGESARVNWNRIAELREQSATPYVNLHLVPRTDGQQARGVEAIIRQMVDDVSAATRQFGPGNVMVENVPYRAGGPFARTAVDPEAIRRVLDETGCGLLLDLAHARITALELGWDEREYLSGLPVDRLRELHVTGLCTDPTGRVRDHMPLTDPDWDLLEWALAQIRLCRWARPWVVACEYGGVGPVYEWRSDPAVIAGQIPRLHSLTRAAAGVG